MLVRSISQLPVVENNFTEGKIEISVPDTENATMKYSSRAITFQTIEDHISAVTNENITDIYGLTMSIDGQSTPINLSNEIIKLNKISAENTNLSGVKNFQSWPMISADYPTPTEIATKYGGHDGDYIMPNAKKVNEMILNTPVYMSTTSSYVAEGNPLNYQGALNVFGDESIVSVMSYDRTIGQGKHYFWQIDDGGYDSSKSVKDKASGSVDGYEEMRETGNLVMWGWLADQGGVEPWQAWVGLFAKLKTEGNDNTQMEVPICIQPWITGPHSSTMQYVGFNVSVRKGLRLVVKTGFPVNSRPSGLNVPGSMVFRDRWIPNAFFGYVIK